MNTAGIKLITADKRIILSQDHDAIGIIFTSFKTKNTMKQIVPIPIPLFETAVTVLFVISPPDLKVPDIISIRQDIPRVILTSTVYI